MRNSRVDKLYPEHVNALQLANLVLKEVPKMNEIKKMSDDSRNRNKEKDDLKKRQTSRNCYFYIGVCNVWRQKNLII